MRASVIALALALAVSLPGSIRAQVRYTDPDGVTHWVDSIDKVPEQYRAADKKAKETERGLGQKRSEPAPTPTARPSLAPPFDNGGFRLLVDSCIGKTRQTFQEKDRLGRVVGESKFNAFVSGPGSVSLSGTLHERFAFRQCMAAEGIPLSDGQ